VDDRGEDTGVACWMGESCIVVQEAEGEFW
jgi:hypothetical protein